MLQFTDGADLELQRLRWRCRRGMKELDVLLERFAVHGLMRVRREEYSSLERLLELPDPILADYLFGQALPRESELACLVRLIRRACDISRLERQRPSPGHGLLDLG